MSGRKHAWLILAPIRDYWPRPLQPLKSTYCYVQTCSWDNCGVVGLRIRAVIRTLTHLHVCTCIRTVSRENSGGPIVDNGRARARRSSSLFSYTQKESISHPVPSLASEKVSLFYLKTVITVIYHGRNYVILCWVVQKYDKRSRSPDVHSFAQ